MVMGGSDTPPGTEMPTGASLLSCPQMSRWFLLLLGLATALLPFALTLPYSSISHREIATELSFPAISDTRLFIAVVAATAFAIAVMPVQVGKAQRSNKKAALAGIGGLLVLIAMNAISPLVRGGPSDGACGFPFAFRKWDIPNGTYDDHAAIWADVIVAILVSGFFALGQLQYVRRASRLKRMAVMLSLAVAVYTGLFSCSWLTGKRASVVNNGVTVREVEVHQTEVMYLTQPMWEPAFWFMERVCGYRYLGYCAAMEDSAFAFEK